MTGLGPSRHQSSTFHNSGTAPANLRDASGSSGVWKKPATQISIPVNDGRLPHPHDGPYSTGSDQFDALSRPPGNHNVKQTILGKPAKDDHPLRPHDNPYSKMSNTLNAKSRRPGNPITSQTILQQPRKRQKLDHDTPSGPTPNGVASSSARGFISRSNGLEPDVQVIEPRRGTKSRSNPPNDAEIISLENSSDDLGERVPRDVETSPDPLLIRPLHAFETHPMESISSAAKKGKGRAKESSALVVEGSEGSEEIDQFPSPPRQSRPSKTSPIPANIVQDRKSFYEGTSSASAPAAIRQPVLRTVDFVSRTVTSVGGAGGTVVSQMKGKSGSARGDQRRTSAVDHIGTSSSNLVNSKHDTPVLALEACCIGFHMFRHSETRPLKLTYEPMRQRVKVIWGLEKIEFKLDRDVDAAMVVNDSEGALKTDVVIQFNTTKGQDWKAVERKYKGFQGGGDRGREKLTFHFSTKDRFATDYQIFVTGIKKALKDCAVQTIVPPGGTPIWDFASRYAEMFEQTESRKEDCSESTVDRTSVAARSVTPSSSTSVKTRTSCPDNKPRNGDLGVYMPRRSTRQSAIQSSKISSPAVPSPQLEPDEIILMYPPSGTGGLSIMHSDLRRLQPEEYLNDTLIEFGLKLWLNDLRSTDPMLADQIYVFSSFFYKKLNNKKNPEDGYQSVRKWTSKVDLFAKKYVIVPINENIHWYLAVIYEPGHTLEPPLPPSHTSGARLTRKRKQTQERAEANLEVAVSEPVPSEVPLKRTRFSMQGLEAEQETDISSMGATRATTPSSIKSKDMVVDKPCSSGVGPELVSSKLRIRDPSPPDLGYPPSEYMDVDAEMSVTDVAQNESHEIVQVPDSPRSKSLSGIPTSRFYGSILGSEETKPVVIADGEDSVEDQEQEAEVDNMLAVTHSSSGDWPAQTHIFTFDSLGSRHPQAIKVLGRYLEWEAKDKRNFDQVRAAIGKQVQVPVQPNTWDCGIYLLHFVKVLMSAPGRFVDRILTTRGTIPSSERRKMWQDHEIPQSREHLKSRIMKLSEEWMAGKTSREGETSKQGNGDTVEMEVLSSEGEVDIVEDVPTIKSGPRLKQKRPATRLRG